jgi:5-methylcytosine-specific restriction endonuclease McrA
MPNRKTPPFKHYPTWTTSKFWSFVRAGLRAKFTRWPPKYECLDEAKRPYVGESKRQKWEYQCACCEEWFPQKSVEVDHIIPCGSLKDYQDLPGFVQRLFVSKEDMQVVCKPCHRGKTKKDIIE